eukprot:7264551-Pyramimonas_sp.AAC.1
MPGLTQGLYPAAVDPDPSRRRPSSVPAVQSSNPPPPTPSPPPPPPEVGGPPLAVPFPGDLSQGPSR